MAGTNSSGRRSEKNGWTCVLGVDPAAAGPTGYGIVESDGRRCRMLHYGSLKVAAKRQKKYAGAALQDVHALLCRLIKEFSPDAVAVESVFTALNMLRRRQQNHAAGSEGHHRGQRPRGQKTDA